MDRHVHCYVCVFQSCRTWQVQKPTVDQPWSIFCEMTQKGQDDLLVRSACWLLLTVSDPRRCSHDNLQPGRRCGFCLDLCCFSSLNVQIYYDLLRSLSRAISAQISSRKMWFESLHLVLDQWCGVCEHGQLHFGIMCHALAVPTCFWNSQGLKPVRPNRVELVLSWWPVTSNILQYISHSSQHQCGKITDKPRFLTILVIMLFYRFVSLKPSQGSSSSSLSQNLSRSETTWRVPWYQGNVEWKWMEYIKENQGTHGSTVLQCYAVLQGFQEIAYRICWEVLGPTACCC